MGHKDARAIQQLQGVKKDDPFDTDEKKIHELRKQRDPALGVIAVNRYDFIDALFRAYDTEVAAVAQLGPACSALLKRAEEAEAREQELMRVEANLAAEIERLRAIVADPHGVFGAPSLSVVPDQEEPGLNPAEQGLDSVEEQTLNADAEADRQEESTQVPVPQAAEAIMDSGTAPGVPPVEAT